MNHVTINRSEIQRLTSVLHSKTTESPFDDSQEKHGDKRVTFHAAISTPIVTSGVSNIFMFHVGLCNHIYSILSKQFFIIYTMLSYCFLVLKEEIGSPAELAKSYMGSRPTNQAPRQGSELLPRTSFTPVAQKTANSLRNLENGFATPRSRGRSAMYTMARSPYFKSPSTSSQQVCLICFLLLNLLVNIAEKFVYVCLIFRESNQIMLMMLRWHLFKGRKGERYLCNFLDYRFG